MRIRIFLVLVIVSLSLTRDLTAQKLSLIAQVGRSGYDQPGGMAEGGDASWKDGIIAGIGVRLKASKCLEADGTIEYSTHKYGIWPWGETPSSGSRNTIWDLNIVGRLPLRLTKLVSVSLSAGVGFWYQKEDRVTFILNPQYARPEESNKGIGGVLGGGVKLDLSDGIQVYSDVTWRIRKYVTTVIQIGVAYGLD